MYLQWDMHYTTARKVVFPTRWAIGYIRLIGTWKTNAPKTGSDVMDVNENKLSYVNDGK